jgi:hypothetical protein
MTACWYFHRFDYERYLALRPTLRAAVVPAAFEPLADTLETRTIVEALENSEISLLAAKQAFVQELCCRGEAIPFHKGFPSFVAALGRSQEIEEGTELLSRMLAGGKNLEAWLQPAAGLNGFLTPEETVTLQKSCALLLRGGRLHVPGRKRRKRIRRGGLLGLLRGFLRRLFDREPPPEEILALLGELVEEAVRRGEGIAVVAT